ncbi:MAG TPA: tetratricopeptide repeat protein [Candidatus Woesebacteria bacterium]|nr:tetratricopeptide repeat protein [Candidatus Woesebacteria bacterium]
MRIRHQLILLFCLTALCYLPFVNSPFIWDDQQFVTENQTIQSFNFAQMFKESTTAGGGINSNYYRPLTSISFAIDTGWWGNNPIGFHLTNLVLHLTAGLLLFWLLINLGLSNRWRFWVTTFFLLHPVQTEAVTYISSRGDSLSTVFLLFGLNSFWLSFQKKKLHFSLYDLQISFSQPFLLFTSALSLILAVLSKELALSGLGLYGLILLLHLFQTQQTIKVIFSKYLPTTIAIVFLLILGLGYTYVRQTTLNFDPDFDYSVIDPQYPSSLSVRLLTFTRALPRYIGTFAFPYALHMDHVLPVIHSILNPWTISVFLVSILIVLLSILEKNKLKTLWLGFGVLWFVIGLVPISGIVPVNGLFYEHWLYIPIVGLLISTAALLRLINNFLSKQKKLKQAQQVFSDLNLYLPGFVLLIMIVITLRQNYIWSDHIRFYEYTLRFTQSARLYNNLAMAQADRGNVTGALENYQNALAISPGYPQIYHNIGNLLQTQGESVAALEYFQKALEVDPTFTFSYSKALQLAIGLKDASASAQILQLAQTYLPEAYSEKLILMAE